MRDLLKERIKHDQKIGAKIRTILKERGMTQMELGSRVNVPRSTFNQMCLGVLHMQPATLCKVADELGVTVDELVSDKEIECTDGSCRIDWKELRIEDDE